MVKLLLPCGGRADRMGGVTKELLPLGLQSCNSAMGRPSPVLAWALTLGLNAGAKGAIVVTSSVKASPLMDAISSLDFPVPICYVHQREPNGLAAAVLCAEPFVSDQDTVLLLLPDTVMWPDKAVQSAVAAAQLGAVACVTLYQVPTPELFGVAVLDEHNHLRRIEDKPKSPESNWVWTAVAFRRAFFSYLNKNMQSSGDSFANALNAAIRDGCLQSECCPEGVFMDVGTYEGYVSALESLSKHRVHAPGFSPTPAQTSKAG